MNIAGHHFAGDITTKTPDQDVPKILEIAKKAGFTTHGEMFSAPNLATLASQYFPQLSSSVKQNFTGRDIFERLCAQQLCLVPYDKDKNHQPCCLGGSKAHWALLAGLVIPLSTSTAPQISAAAWSRLDLEEEFYVAHLEMQDARQVELKDEQLGASFVIALHGKSRHQALWTLQSLCESNQNLQRPGDDLIQKGDYVLPDTLDNLKDHIIFCWAGTRK